MMIEKIVSKENLLVAYKSVVSNKGSSGVDGLEVKEIYLTKQTDEKMTKRPISQVARPDYFPQTSQKGGGTLSL